MALREERQVLARAASPTALALALAVLAEPDESRAGCLEVVACVASCPNDACAYNCLGGADAEAQGLFQRYGACLNANCPYDTSDSCVQAYCGYEEQACAADSDGSSGYGPVYAGPVVAGDIDNFTFKFGGGYVFDQAEGGLLDMAIGWEHLWIFGPETDASTVQFGIDLLMEMITADPDLVLAFAGAVDVKYYFGTDLTAGLPWTTFGLGAMLGGGSTLGDYETDGVPFLIAAPEVSLQWIYPFGGGFDLYGGAIVLFGNSTEVAPFVGLRGVMDVTLFASNI
jgi:hypothetical protein